MGPAFLAFLTSYVTVLMKTKWNFTLVILEVFHLLEKCLPTEGRYEARLSMECLVKKCMSIFWGQS